MTVKSQQSDRLLLLLFIIFGEAEGGTEKETFKENDNSELIKENFVETLGSKEEE